MPMAEPISSLALMCWGLNLLADTGGHLSFKAAANVADNIHGLQRWLTMFKDKWIWIGVILFACEFVIWIAFLSLVPLSVGVLLASLNTAAIMIGGRLFFHERLTPKRVGAAVLITIGVALVGLGQA
jgi:drug/metabolite transporter (DMT)-like permease